MFFLDLTLVKHDSSSLGLWTQPCWHCQDSSQSRSQDWYQEQGTCKVCSGISISVFQMKNVHSGKFLFSFSLSSDSLVIGESNWWSKKQVINFTFDSITYGLVKTTCTLKKLVRLAPPTNKATFMYFKTFWQPWRSHVIPSQTGVSWQVPAKTHFLV